MAFFTALPLTVWILLELVLALLLHLYPSSHSFLLQIERKCVLPKSNHRNNLVTIKNTPTIQAVKSASFCLQDVRSLANDFIISNNIDFFIITESWTKPDEHAQFIESSFQSTYFSISQDCQAKGVALHLFIIIIYLFIRTITSVIGPLQSKSVKQNSEKCEELINFNNKIEVSDFCPAFKFRQFTDIHCLSRNVLLILQNHSTALQSALPGF